MTLLENFIESLKEKNILDAFYYINEIVVYDSLENKQYTISEIVKFVNFFIKNYENETIQIFEESEEEPYIFFVYNIIKNAQDDIELLNVIDNKLNKKIKYELLTLKKDIEKIIDKYGIINIGKSGFITIDDEKLQIKNDIYIQNKNQLNTKMVNNFFKVSFLLDYCFINIITYNEKLKSNVMISYHIVNHSWQPIKKETIELALAEISEKYYDKETMIIEECEKKY